MSKLVVLRIGEGSFDQGFPVVLQIGDEGKPPVVEVRGSLPAAPQLPQLYADWRSHYGRLGGLRIRVPVAQVTNVSSVDKCESAAQALQTYLKNWFNDPAMRELREHIREEVSREEQARIILQTQNQQLQKLPWHLWDLLERRPKAELTLSSDYAPPSLPLQSPVKILAVFGNADQIDVRHDEATLNQLPNASVTLLKQPRRQEFNEYLWHQPWDILFFAGHSSQAQGWEDGTTTGQLQINDTESISFGDLRYALKRSVETGLKLVILNSCDGLALVPHLTDVKVPRVIVMREPVPDPVAQAFLRYFLTAFSKGESLYLSVRIAREQLQGMEADFPCASWLPIICQNPVEPPLTWPPPKPQRRSLQPSRRILLPSLLVLAILSTIPLWHGLRRLESASMSPIPTPDAQPSRTIRFPGHTKTFEDFATQTDIPLGLWRYGGSTAWAAIRAKADEQIKADLPRFQLIYTQDPIEGPSSGTGITMLTEGRLAFSQVSRPLTDDEIARARQRGFALRQTAVAYDAIVVIVHPSLEVEGLTVQQLVGIYTSKITNWRQVGGPDLAIRPYESNLTGGSPTILRSFFAEGEEFGATITMVSGPSEAIRRVSNPSTPAERGGLYMASSRTVLGQCLVKPLAIGRDNQELIPPYQGDRVTPEQCPERRNRIDPAVIITGEYPLARQLYVVTREDNSLESKAGYVYTELLLTEEGQQLIQEAGFIPMRSF